MLIGEQQEIFTRVSYHNTKDTPNIYRGVEYLNYLLPYGV